MKRKLFAVSALFFIVCILCTACAESVGLHELTEADFALITEQCEKLTYENRYKLPRYGQFFIENGANISSNEYEIEEIKLVRHVYEYVDGDGNRCLALPFEAVISCKKSESTFSVWDILVLVDPVRKNDGIAVDSFELLNGGFVVFYADGFNSVLEAMESDFEYTHTYRGYDKHVY